MGWNQREVEDAENFVLTENPTVKCPKCNTENREGRKFCAECGAKLGWMCSECGFENEADERFCGGCGRAFDAEASTPTVPPKLEDMQKQLQDRISQPLADRLFAGAKQMQDEYRLVTALFADVVGSSRMARDMPLKLQFISIARKTAEG